MKCNNYNLIIIIIAIKNYNYNNNNNNNNNSNIVIIIILMMIINQQDSDCMRTVYIVQFCWIFHGLNKARLQNSAN